MDPAAAELREVGVELDGRRAGELPSYREPRLRRRSHARPASSLSAASRPRRWSPAWMPGRRRGASCHSTAPASASMLGLFERRCRTSACACARALCAPLPHPPRLSTPELLGVAVLPMALLFWMPGKCLSNR
ncbi:hypothetical protein EJB05_01488 [Eragrostis curvula]|uniref:Uncharacterized protein n=1 Tax=Eragrostis curvula TaxID=38414 RepID=A0A5J9WPU5_9POAL|nr:hypothetical protein EJB05_01488 [Eragrostis curvula]